MAAVRSAAVSRAAALRHPRKHPAWACRPQSLWLETPWSVLEGGGPRPSQGALQTHAQGKIPWNESSLLHRGDILRVDPHVWGDSLQPHPGPKTEVPFCKESWWGSCPRPWRPASFFVPSPSF